MSTNKIMIRLQNLADLFDKDSTTAQVNTATMIEGMWKSTHGEESQVGPYTMVETSVTGNMPVEEMQQRRLKWKTVDDGKYQECKINYENDKDIIDLEP
jgi:hypothetical protein